MTLIFISIGIFAGALSGIFGIGGGIVIVPLLVIVAKMLPQMATGTSLGALLLPLGAAIGAWSYYRNGNLNIAASLWIAAGMVIGVYIGAVGAQSISPLLLRRAFAVFLVLVAGKMWVG